MSENRDRRRIAVESIAIALIGVADLVTTILWIRHNGADEANPLFRFYLSMGFFWFTVIKMVFLAGPILILECARRRRPAFTRWASRFAIVAYVSFYAVGIARLNPQLFHRRAHHRAAPTEIDFSAEWQAIRSGYRHRRTPPAAPSKPDGSAPDTTIAATRVAAPGMAANL